MIAGVAVSVRAKAVDKLYDYRVPEGMAVEIGTCVEVGFGSRKVEGYVIEVRADDGGERPLRDVSRVLGADAPKLTGDLIELTRFLRERYFCSWGAALQAILPPPTRTRERRLYALGPRAAEPGLPPAVSVYLEKREAADEAGLARLGVKRADLAMWVRDGFLVRADRIEPRRKARTVRVARALAPSRAADGGRPPGERQKAALAYLRASQDAVPIPRLLQELGLSSSVLDSLVRRGWIEVFEEIAPTAEPASDAEESQALSDEQQRAAGVIRAALNDRREDVFVLRGVTGSGKTEVYMRAVAHALGAGRQALVLVPEIALTAQMQARFRRRFGRRVAVLHSSLSARDKYREWHRIQTGDADVVLGARSAVFAPLSDIGLVVVDEEHETSYKQDADPRYVTREVAIWRARRAKAAVVLGSATPSLESAYRAERGIYRELRLEERVRKRPLAKVSVVDMREEMRAGSRTLFSRALRAALEERLTRREQVLLFLNRRGFSTLLLCRECGEVATCPSCDIALTLHRAGVAPLLRCHFCGHAEPVRTTCHGCGSARVRQFGAGTQRVEQELLDQFPGVRVIRMDVDTTAAQGAHERLVDAFERGEADVLLGTQMVAKGLDFSRVSLVGVIAADTSLRVPDFRSAERTFQLLVQVAGRAGRHEIPGEVIVQTFAPDHYAVQAAARQDYTEFYRLELASRRALDYPPFTEVAQFVIAHKDERKAREHAERLREDLVKAASELAGVRVLPATPTLVGRAKGLFRYQVVVKYRAFKNVRDALSDCYQRALAEARGEVRVHIDVNAYSLA